MKKIVLLLVIMIMIGCTTGCVKDKQEEELCEKIDQSDVYTYTKDEKYDELATILDGYFTTYCQNKNTEVCNALDNFVMETKKEVEFQDCTNLEGNWKELCQTGNKLKVSTKKTTVAVKQIEVRNACTNEKRD